MSAAATVSEAGTPADPAVGRNALAGTGTLLRFVLRRDRIRLPVWVGAIALVQVSGAASYPDLYPTEADRQGQAAIMGENPAMKAMTGPGYGLDNYTYGAMMANEYLGFMVIFVALMSVLMVIRHSRSEEETGRADLVRAYPVGRYAPLTAVLLAAAIANLLLGLLVALGMGSLGIETIDWPGSFAFGAAYAMVGLVFAAIAAVTAQITEYGRAASGMAGALIGVGYMLRAIGDAGDNALSWLSPIGWAQAAAPYVDNDWRPLGLGLVVTLGLGVLAFALGNRRDVGAGLRTERTGAATGSALLGTPVGFAWRLQRASVVWWSIAMLLFGSAYGSAIDVVESYEGNQAVQEIIKNLGGATLTESWLAMIIALLSVVCTIFAVIAALRPRREETSGRAESVLATALSRSRWLASHVAIAMLGGVFLLLVTGVGLGLGAAVGSGDTGLFGEVVGAMLAYAPALWVTAALSVTVLGVAPRAIALAWALVVYAILVVYLGGLLDLPGWMLDISPYTHVPRMPVEEFTAPPLVVLTLVAAGLIGVGFVGFRRRDIESA